MRKAEFDAFQQKQLLTDSDHPLVIEFVKVTTKRDNRRTRRGNYHFQVLISEESNNEILELAVNINIQPTHPDYYIQKVFTTITPSLREDGDMLKAYMDSNNTEAIMDLELLDEIAINKMKLGIKFGFANRNYWEYNKGNGNVIFNVPKIGKFSVFEVGYVTEDFDEIFK